MFPILQRNTNILSCNHCKRRSKRATKCPHPISPRGIRVFFHFFNFLLSCIKINKSDRVLKNESIGTEILINSYLKFKTLQINKASIPVYSYEHCRPLASGTIRKGLELLVISLTLQLIPKVKIWHLFCYYKVVGKLFK